MQFFNSKYNESVKSNNENNKCIQLTTQKMTPVVNFINILRTNFSYEHHFGSFFCVHVSREKLLKRCSYKKFARLTLMKLTTDLFLQFTTNIVSIKLKLRNLYLINHSIKNFYRTRGK